VKAFFIGLLFIVAVGLLLGVGILLYPFFILTGFMLQILVWLFFIIFSVWLLGKFIIFVWGKLSKK